MRTIICTTGTSISQGVQPLSENISPQQYRDGIHTRLRDLRQQPKDFLRKACAESNSLRAFGAGKNDRAILLHTDTPDGQICAEEIQKMLSDDLGLHSELEQVRGLQVTDAAKFRREGVQNLFAILEKWCRPSLDSQDHSIFLNINGGFKSVVPYLTLFGQLHLLPVIYLFERSDQLITLPPVPIQYDYERLSRAREALLALVKQGVMPKRDFLNLIPSLAHHERDWYESLLEVEDDQATLSAFGLLLTEALKRDRAEVYLSPAASKQYGDSSGAAKEQFTFMLERVAEPLWRQGKRHRFAETDLSVFKPGKTSERMACIVHGTKVYVCELLRHDEYIRVLPTRQQANYNLSEFARWTRPQDVESSPLTEDEAFIRTRRQVDELEQVWKDAEVRLQACSSNLQEAKTAAQTAQNERDRAIHDVSESRIVFERSQQEQSRQIEDLKQTVIGLQRANRPWWKRLLGRP